MRGIRDEFQVFGLSKFMDGLNICGAYLGINRVITIPKSAKFEVINKYINLGLISFSRIRISPRQSRDRNILCHSSSWR